MPQGFGNNSKPINLSLCAIAKNEAHRLARCLESVTNLVDEIILVDTGSTDNTVVIAKKFGSKVVKFNWCDDFAQARNYGLHHANGQWILVLDADEVLNAEVIPYLRQVMAQPDCLAANLVRHEVGARQTPYSLVSRLFRRHKDIYFTGFYHESIDDSIQKYLLKSPQWQVANVEVVAIAHYGYHPNEIERRNKAEFAQRLMLKHLAAYPQDSYMYGKLGALYVENGDVEAGLQLLLQGSGLAQKSNHQDYLTLFELYYHLSLAYSYKQDEPMTQHYLQLALELPVPSTVKLPAYNNLGNFYQEQGLYTEAIAAYQTVTKIAPQFAQGYYNLGIALKAAGDFPQAITAYEQAIAIEPDYAEAYQNLGVVMMRSGKVPEALVAFQRSIECYEKQQKFEAVAQLRSGLRELGLMGS